MRKDHLPFQRWLSQTVKPILTVVVGGLFFLTAALEWVAFESSVSHYDQAVTSFGRMAEILIEKKDIAGLNALGEFFLSKYPGSEIILKKDSRIEWRFPSLVSIDESKSSSFPNIYRSFPIKTAPETVSTIFSPFYSAFRWPLVAGAIAITFLGLILSVFSIFFRRWNNHFLLQLHSLAANGHSEITELQKFSDQLTEATTQRAKHELMGRLASQVAHDIRSPLAALEMINQMSTELPEDHRFIVRSAVGRIRDIANSLLAKDRELTRSFSPETAALPAEEPSQSLLLTSLVGELTTEKRLQFRSKISIEIDFEPGSQSYGLFVEAQPIELKRVLSNLVNNAVEAMGESGRVKLRIEASENPGQITLSLEDNGKGIPAELLARLGQRGVTHDKEGGSGLGLFHARTAVEKWRGALEIKSTVGHGTQILLRLLRANEPVWFLPELRVDRNTQMVVIDDDPSIHQIWRGRFESIFSTAECKPTLLHFVNPDELIIWQQHHATNHSSILYLCDYELIGHPKTGLDTIQELGIAQQSILVTSRFEEPEILNRCISLGIKLIPKGLAGTVPIKLNSGSGDQTVVSKQKPAAILIDDDLIVHMNWKMAAKKAQLDIRTYTKAEDFMKEAHQFDFSTPIYIDSNLEHGVKGEEVAKSIYLLRFNSIYLATGYGAASFLNTMPHIQGIQGKEPPF